MCSTQHSNMRRWAAAPDYFYLLHLTPASHGMHACWCTRRLIAVINGESSLQNSVVSRNFLLRNTALLVLNCVSSQGANVSYVRARHTQTDWSQPDW